MLKFLSSKSLGMLAVAALFFAKVGAITPFCWALHYEPDIPESMRK